MISEKERIRILDQPPMTTAWELITLRSRLQWAARIVLCVAVVCIVGLLLTACGERNIRDEPENRLNINRQGPDEYGIVCYARGASQTLSCVKT